MLRVGLLVVMAAACSKAGPPEIDCHALLADPGNALTKLTERESDPSKIYAMLERCLAPSGDTCDRAAAGGAMMPSMAISDGSAGGAADRAAQWKQYAADCRTLSPDKQQCLLLSYAITHPECGKVQEDFRRAFPPGTRAE
ncbi:MAG: hypothetical protein H0T79_16150 [Deltaproteobacteria bacterium]|nr:hypothetical protein [Deltaproteobacteria bacterium]